MGAVFRRLRDVGYALFFLFHLAIILLANTQLVLDRKLFPKELVDFQDKLVKDAKDPLFGNAPTWFQALIWFELFTYVPFLFLGFFGALTGERWIRIPSIMYATSLITELIPMLGHIFYDSFSGPGIIGPKTKDERMYASFLYAGFFLVGVCLLLDNLFYRGNDPINDVGVSTTYVGGKKKNQ
ncbi:hypothetical protein RvY_14436 [Ramazzottius varieornatus]|uniref:Sigma intracellular receptor 2 n=1 Tax=Ramazzottius varieornatus TaxID=947166 RepID=A0A1D1VWD3_RAMVA|nr:hypothetical protein RvY_14436 [Ramazzottius varieornatus]